MVLAAIALSGYVNHDRLELIDRPDVAEVAESACRDLSAAIAATPYDRDASVSQRVAVIRKQDLAITALISEVLELDADIRAADIPIDSWLDDWADLRTARERYADDLGAAGDPGLVVPRSDGVPITDRMSSLLVDCEAADAMSRLG